MAPQDADRVAFRADEPFWARREELDAIQTLTAGSASWPGFSIGRYRARQPTGIGPGNQPVPFFMAVVVLRKLPPHDLWRNQLWHRVGAMPVGSLSLYDLSEQWVTDLSFPVDSFHAYIPYSAFDAITAELKLPSIRSLPAATKFYRDETMMYLTNLLLPVLERPWEAVSLFTDHVFAAMATHLITFYGGPARIPPVVAPRWPLTPAQLRHVTARLLDDITANPSLDQLAMLCGFSRGHFIRAFRHATGLPPYRWLLNERVNRAQVYLDTTELPLADIALSCGFSDQAHMTRMFSRILGVSPGAWRRQRRN